MIEDGEPIPPGDVIRAEMARRGWPLNYTAALIDVSAEELGRMLGGDHPVDEATSAKLGPLFGLSETFLVNYQRVYDKATKGDETP